MSEIESVSEQDKPFILAITGAAITLALVITAIFTAYYGLSDALEIQKQAITAFLALDQVAWTFYLVKKKER